MAEISEERRSLRLRLICVTPPPRLHEGQPTIFGLQDKRQTLDPGQPQYDGSVAYECVLGVRHEERLGSLRFSGQYVHGNAGDPFLYLSWGPDSGAPPWIRRLKISLASITWDQVLAADGGLIEASTAGTGSARVPLLGEGWEVRHDRDHRECDTSPTSARAAST